MHPTHSPSQKILRTGIALLSVQGITWISSFASVLVMPRFLGPGDFGILAAVGTVVMLMSLLASFGSTNFLIKETARAPEKTRELALHTVGLRAVFWLTLSLVVLPPVFYFSDSGMVRLVMAVSLAAGLAALVVEGLYSAFQGNQRLGRVSLLLSSFGLLGQVAVLSVVVAGGGLAGAALVGLVAASASMLIVGLLFLATFRGSVNMSRATARSILRAGPPYLAWDLGLRVYATVDMILLPVLVGSVALGSYAFASRLVFIPVFATTIITMAVYPALSASASADRDLFKRVVNSAARFAFMLTTPMVAGLAVVSGPLVRLLSGGEFDDSALIMVILAVRVPAAAVHTILGTSLFARDMQKRMASVAWLAVGFNLCANLVAIPVADRWLGNGAFGAAIVSVATEVVMGVFVWRWAWGTVGPDLLVGFAKTLVATGVMSVATFVACSWGGIFVAIPVGAVTYFVCGAAIGVFSLREVNHLRLQFFGARQALSIEP